MVKPKRIIHHQEQRNRERLIVDAVSAFLQATKLFQGHYKKYSRGKLTFADVRRLIDDKGESALFRLKGLCHKLFRKEGNSRDRVSREELFDLAVGSIFHTAMKVREELYQIEYYKPKYLELDIDSVPSGLERDLCQLFKEIMDKVEKDLKVEMEEVRELFVDTAEHMKSLLKDFSENALLVRYLLENRSLIAAVYGNDSFHEIFRLMFRGGIVEAQMRAGKSYLESAHYDEAAPYFQQAREGAPRLLEPAYLYHYARGMGAYYQNNYPQVLVHLTEARRYARGMRKKDAKGRERMTKVLREIESEYREHGDVERAAETKALLRTILPRKKRRRKA